MNTYIKISSRKITRSPCTSGAAPSNNSTRLRTYYPNRI